MSAPRVVLVEYVAGRASGDAGDHSRGRVAAAQATLGDRGRRDRPGASARPTRCRGGGLLVDHGGGGVGAAVSLEPQHLRGAGGRPISLVSSRGGLGVTRRMCYANQDRLV